MLKEFNHIARQMLFLHGHLTRPLDWAENASTEAATTTKAVIAILSRSPSQNPVIMRRFRPRCGRR